MWRLKLRVEAWEDWKKYSHFSWFENLMVLLKIKRCIWFEEYWVKPYYSKRRHV